MEQCGANAGMLSQVMECSLGILRPGDRWHADGTAPALEQKHTTAEATLIKRYKYCIRCSVSGSQDFLKMDPSLGKKPVLVKLNRTWSPANSEEPLHENELIHDIRKGGVVTGTVRCSLSSDYKSRPYNSDVTQYASFARVSLS